MRYIKIKAKTYNEAMMKLKMDHGDDAIPISHKYVKEGGLFNSKLLAKQVVELTAAVHERKTSKRLLSEKRNIDVTVDDKNLNNHKEEKKTSPLDAIKKTEKQGEGVNLNSLNRTIDDLNDNLNGFKSKLLDPDIHGPVPEKRIEEKQQIIEVKNENQSQVLPVNKFEKEFNEIKDVLKTLVSDRKLESESTFTSDSNEERVMKTYMDILRNNDFDNDQCITMINEVKNSVSKDDLKDKYKIEKSLKDLLKTRVETTGPFQTGNKKKIIMFIGPTGVGKTTTMAKLGAIYSLREAHNVVFVTLDNYRIAATEQLKKYAEIMDIPVHVVNSQKEFKDIISKDKAEIIMVDTSGRSHRNELKISEIKTFAELVEYDFEKVLCVSANTKKRDLNEIFRSFDTMNFNTIIVTKVDETSFIGNVVDVADKFKKPISYFTNGQEVPNDIVIADPDKIVDMMIGDDTI